MKKSAMFFILIILITITSITFSADLQTELTKICNQLKDLFTILLVFTIILSAAAYGIGQILSAEMRARAVVWAQGMILAAIFAAILYVTIPYILWYMVKGSPPQGIVDCNSIQNLQIDVQ